MKFHRELLSKVWNPYIHATQIENLPTPVFLPTESHGQRSLVGHSPGGHKQLDTT